MVSRLVRGWRHAAWALGTTAALLLTACGGGGGGGAPFGGTGGGDGGGGGGGGGVTPTVPVVTMAVTLLDSNGTPTTAVVGGQPLRAQATLKRDGVAVANEIVQFSLEQSLPLVRVDPASGSQLTDSNGVATVTVTSAGASSGAGRVRATATLGTQSATSAANFFASGSTSPPPSSLSLGGFQIFSPTVSAYGTTQVQVQVQQNGQPFREPVTVNFSSSCAAGRATITPSAETQQNTGLAVATFVDNGCAQNAAATGATVTVTASISSDSESGSFQLLPPTTGSLRFISVVPSDRSITLRGQGGNGRQENASVTFRLVDVAGQGVANADVCFDITTYIGGLNVDGFGLGLSPPSPGSPQLCGSDNLSIVRYVKRTNPDGSVTVQINSGTVPTPVRVRARALYPAGAALPLETFSDTLSVSTGLPIQRSFSLSIDKANIDGGNFDGEVAVVTARLADQFSNPVPDGTVVNFVGSGGSVCTADNGSCRTVNGACTCQVISQERRPEDRRIVITAYAVGLEDYDDRDGDNVYTPFINALTGTPQKCTDANVVAGRDCFYDLGDAFVDANKNNVAADGSGTATTPPNTNPTIFSDTDILIPYQNPTRFTSPGDGVRSTAHIRASTIVYFSQSSTTGNPTVILPRGSLSEAVSLSTGTVANPFGLFVRLQPFCPAGAPVPQAGLSFALEDGLGNPMAAGTTVAAVDLSTNLASGGVRPAAVAALGARPPLSFLDLPNIPKPKLRGPADLNDAQGVISTGHSITVRGVEDKCAGNGTLQLQVASPRGGPAIATVRFEGDRRPTASRAGDPSRPFQVRYVEELEATAANIGARTVEITGLSYSRQASPAVRDPAFQAQNQDPLQPDGPLLAPPSFAGTVTVNWGDGTSNVYNVPLNAIVPSRVYAAAGLRTITISLRSAGGNLLAVKSIPLFSVTD